MFHTIITCVPNTVLLSDRKALAQGEADRPTQVWRAAVEGLPHESECVFREGKGPSTGRRQSRAGR